MRDKKVVDRREGIKKESVKNEEKKVGLPECEPNDDRRGWKSQKATQTCWLYIVKAGIKQGAGADGRAVHAPFNQTQAGCNRSFPTANALSIKWEFPSGDDALISQSSMTTRVEVHRHR